MSPLNHDAPRDAAADLSRRRFLQVMGASMALASASGCTWDAEEILPFARRPEGRVPGKTRRFATALEQGGFAASILVTSYDGRPIKIEGNPLHPLERGAASARTQAAILDLYDPDHSSGLVQSYERRHWPRTWAEFDPWFAAVVERARTRRGQGFAVLCEPSSSLALRAVRERFRAALPDARFVEWTPVTRANEAAGGRLAFGRPVRRVLALDAARTLVTLDADVLFEHPAALSNARAFAARRAPERGALPRHFSIHSTPTVTSATADHALALRAEQVQLFLRALMTRLGLDTARTSGGFLDEKGVRDFLELLVAELREAGRDALVVAGPRQPAIVHALVHRFDAGLGATGRTSRLVEDEDAPPADPTTGLADLVAAMDAGAIEELVILGGNPVHDAPVDLEFRRALRKVPLSLHLSAWRDETSRACTWHLPRALELEAWGDVLGHDGTRCTIQPLIAPLFERRSALELLAAMAGDARGAHAIVRASVAPAASDAEWQRVLHDGHVADSAAREVVVTLAPFDVPATPERAFASAPENGGLELVLAPDPKVHDGRGANNGWLQELPDAITRTTWGNAARVSPRTAAMLGVEDGVIVELVLAGRSLEAAAVVVPGQADGSVTLHLGYGRGAAGRVGGLIEDGVETVGFDAYRLRTRAALDGATGLAVRVTGRRHHLARTTDPHVEDEIGRHGYEERIGELLRETTLAGWTADPTLAELAPHHPPLESLWEHEEPAGARWGMAIDLTTCIGCNACAVACQAENNVPVVGREQVMRGREMHWIRVDRHFLGEADAAKVRFQPITCQHCETAPCEQVCPVAATVHSAEGLNDMVYNRCIGTRYCANNCPFKVRRFNFLDFNAPLHAPGADVRRMLSNPAVTVRHRGVMEKCTFCVQRIQFAKITAKNEGRPIADGEVVPACAQTCPTQAIVFGDLADPTSRVSRLHSEQRSYRMLAELNIRPRTAYLAKITNPRDEEARRGG